MYYIKTWFILNRLLKVSQSHLPYGDGTVSGARSPPQHQQQIRQMLGHISILLVQQVLVCALICESSVFKSQTVYNPVCIFSNQALFAVDQF